MKTVNISLFLGALTTAFASPVPAISKRATTISDQYGVAALGSYTVNQDLWGESGASGGQTTTAKSVTNNAISWSTNWSWEGGAEYSVKSYANGEFTFAPVQLSDIKSMPSTWDWSYTAGENIVGDVAYDAFLSTEASVTGPKTYELMVWLAALGGDQPVGKAVDDVTIGGQTFKLWYGTNVQEGNTVNVYSFVVSETKNSYSGDLMDFYNYLIQNKGVSMSQYLIQLQAGTEAVTGKDAVFSTSSYTHSVNH